MTTLDELAIAYSTDKSSLHHNYCHIYEQHFGPLRHEPIALLELGVFRGSSLRMWAGYFDNPKSQFIGVDSDLDQFISDMPGRTTVWDYDQADPRIAKICRGGFDIVIDDCSHIGEKTVASFEMLWPQLKPAGLYVIEDLFDQDGTGTSKLLWFLTEEVNRTRTWPTKLEPEKYDVAEMHLYPDLAILRRAA